MTIEELRRSEALMVTADDIAPIIGSNPQAIRITARTHPDWLGFPTICVKNRVKIPREPFLRHLGL